MPLLDYLSPHQAYTPLQHIYGGLHLQCRKTDRCTQVELLADHAQPKGKDKRERERENEVWKAGSRLIDIDIRGPYEGAGTLLT